MREYAGGYEDWARQHTAATNQGAELSTKKKKAALSTTTARSAAKPSGLSFKEKHELTDLPKRIEVLESKQRTLSDDMANPDFYRQSPDAIVRVGLELKQVSTEPDHGES